MAKWGGNQERRICAALLNAAEGDEPAREVRLYHYGWNDDTTGSLLFNEEAARLVMAAFKRKQVDGMVDLEHMSLDDTAPNYDADARGSYKLEVRKDAKGKPELWAVIDWAPEGEQRIREKRQRYLSPVVFFDKDTKRIARIFNIALCANPATHGAQPLIAASESFAGRGPVSGRLVRMAAAAKLTPELMSKLMEAFGLPPDGPVGELATALQGAVMELQGQPQPTEGTPPEGEMADDPEPKPEPGKEEEPDHVMAAASHKLKRAGAKKLSASLDAVALFVDMALRKTSEKTLNAALKKIDAFKASHISREESEAKQKAGEKALELIERKQLAASLVACGAETPATIWEDDDAKVLVKRLTDEPIDSLRKRTDAMLAAKGGKLPTAPPKGATGAHGLTAEELKKCADRKIDPAKYAATRAGIAARSTRQLAQGEG
jgi:hypothetical protein